MHQIVIAKIISGDMVVGKLEQRDTGQVLTEVYAVIIHPAHNNPSQIATTILPILTPFNDDAIKELSVDKFVVAMTDAHDELQRVYIKLTTVLYVAIGTRIIQ